MGGYDKAIGALAIGSTAAIMGAAFLPGIGAGMPITSSFAWHTVLMTLGFGFFMSMGRRAYHAELPESMDTSKQSRRMLHIAMMVTASVCVVLGYAGIAIAHYPGKQFFGYDFNKAEWKPLLRILHVYLGYGAIGLVLFQLLVGAMKIKALQEGLARYDIHNKVGPCAHYLGLIAICAGLNIMPWNTSLRLLAMCGTMGVAALMYKASVEVDKSSEKRGILG